MFHFPLEAEADFGLCAAGMKKDRGFKIVRAKKIPAPQVLFDLTQQGIKSPGDATQQTS
jgi:hypothetical protein